MNQLRCEMCGGTNLIKQDGVFLCQNCGMKYSVEEAKKMMIEGTVEVQGTVAVQGAVKIQNTAQVDNLLQLAKSSFDSKNYAQTEVFCNQVIAIDGNNYIAWKIKGEAIYYLSTVSNNRIAEVYNCIMSSYRVLSDADKGSYRDEVLESLRACLEGELDFALDMFQQNRPGDAMLENVKNTFASTGGRIIDASREMEYSEEDIDGYRDYIRNYFIEKVNKISASTWDNVVYYNYYRGGWDDDYHPTVEILKQYLNEGGNVIDLLVYAEKFFNDTTPLVQKRECYRLQNFMHQKLLNAQSFKRMVSTTTNGYGAVIERKEYWEVDQTPSASAKQYRNKELDRTSRLFDAVECQMAQSDPAMKQKMLAQWKKERAAIDTSYKISGGYYFCFVLFAVFIFVSFVFVPDWCDGFGWFGYLLGVVFTVFGIGCVVDACSKAKASQQANIAKAERLDKKIAEIS